MSNGIKSLVLGIAKQVRLTTSFATVRSFVNALFDTGWDRSQVVKLVKLESPIVGDSILDELIASATAAEAKSVKIPNGRGADGALTFQTVAIADYLAKLEVTRIKEPVTHTAIDGRHRLCAARELQAFGVTVDIPTVTLSGIDGVSEAIRSNMLPALKMTREDRLHAALMLWDAGRVRKESDIRVAFGATPSQRTIVQTAWAGACLVKQDRLPVAQVALLDYSGLSTVKAAPKANRKAALAEVLAGKSATVTAVKRSFWERMVQDYPASPIATFAGFVLSGDEVHAEQWLMDTGITSAAEMDKSKG
jgi:hypothetical protein